MKLIDKEKALTAIVHEIRASHSEDAILVGESSEELGLIKAFDIIRQLPAVGERPKGKWIGKPLAGKGTIRCSNCKDAFIGNDGLWNYCPYCGADMRGDDK